MTTQTAETLIKLNDWKNLALKLQKDPTLVKQKFADGGTILHQLVEQAPHTLKEDINRNNYYLCFKLALLQGADVDAKNRNGYPPLHLLVSKDYLFCHENDLLEIAKILVNFGASLSIEVDTVSKTVSYNYNEYTVNNALYLASRTGAEQYNSLHEYLNKIYDKRAYLGVAYSLAYIALIMGLCLLLFSSTVFLPISIVAPVIIATAISTALLQFFNLFPKSIFFRGLLFALGAVGLTFGIISMFNFLPVIPVIAAAGKFILASSIPMQIALSAVLAVASAIPALVLAFVDKTVTKIQNKILVRKMVINENTEKHEAVHQTDDQFNKQTGQGLTPQRDSGLRSPDNTSSFDSSLDNPNLMNHSP